MKFSREEYEDMIIRLNYNKNKMMVMVMATVSAILAFVVGMLIDGGVYFSAVLAIAAAIGARFAIKKSIIDNAKKVNFLRTINFVEQEIYRDKIVEKVVRTGEAENCGEYYYRDIGFVREDKFNFYLYLNDDSAIIVSKNKLGNIEDFEKILRANDLIE